MIWQSMLGNFYSFVSSAAFFKTLYKKLFKNTDKLSNSLDPDQDRHYVGVGPDLGLIWAKTFCIGYQQMTLANQE